MENNLITCPLEFHVPDSSAWGTCFLIGISNEDNYIVQHPNTLRLFTLKCEEMRVVKEITSIRECTDIHDDTFEYETQPGFFSSCKINKRKGNFFSIDIDKITKLVCADQLRQVSSTPFSRMVNEEYENILINIPQRDWVLTEDFKEMIKTIKEDTQVLYTSWELTLRFFCRKEDADSIRLMINTAIEQELKLVRYLDEKNSQLGKLKAIQHELKKTKQYYINKSLTGLIIGAKGHNINRLKQQFRVQIKIQTDIPGDEDLVTIIGEDVNLVEQCINEVNYVKRSYEIKATLEDKLQKSIGVLMQKYHLNLSIAKDKYQDEDKGVYYLSCLHIIGRERSVENLLKEISNYLVK